jgi:hypothetical protein
MIMISDWDAARMAANFGRELADDRFARAMVAAFAAESVPGPRASAGGSTIAATSARVAAEYEAFAARTNQRERIRAWVRDL